MATSQALSKEATLFFTCGADAYRARDAIGAALFRGEVETAWTEILRLVACEDYATEHELQLEETALDAASNAFRYQHDLITAEETEQWLERRGLMLADFSQFFVRHHWGNLLRGKAPARSIPYLSGSPELHDLLVNELVLTDELDRMATRLGWRIAVCEAARDEEIPGELLEIEHGRFIERNKLKPEEVAGWLEQVGRDEKWLQQMCRGEALYRRECDGTLTASERKRELANLRLPLTKFEVEMIELESLDAAHEAFLCVREDGMTMEEVAREGKYPFRRSTRLLEEIPLEYQQRFLSVSAGEVLAPLERGDGYQLCRVTGKSEPDVEDPSVRRRADDRILDRHFAELVGRHLEWRLLTISSE
ncbi:MAG: hypothetical protein H0U99_09265 [Chthoniobacterales bacterium]|nr:hypothetical protein [Chthoniobacterales bacterium]